MFCKDKCKKSSNNCSCQFNVKTFGVGEASRIVLDGSDRTKLNWTEISIPEVVSVPTAKPDIEHLDQVYLDASVSSAKLIETPFAYDSYERQATAYEISSATTAVATAAAIDLTAIQTDVTTILNIVGLPAIPEVADIQFKMAAVTAAGVNLTNVVTKAQTDLAVPCVAASIIVADLNAILEALTVLQKALDALVASANNLVVATASSPVAVQVASDVQTLLLDITTTTTSITASKASLTGAVTLIGFTKVFAIKSNAEGTCLSGRKLVLDGTLKQKVVYTGLVDSQSVHSFCNQIPFSAYIIPYAKFVGLTYQENIEVIENPALPCATITVNGFAYDPSKSIIVDLCENFCVSSLVEDIFAYAIDKRNVFKNITLFLWAEAV